MIQKRRVVGNSKGSITLVDCTLRDGGYLNGHSFTDHQIEVILQILSNSGVNYIEVGYFKRRNYDPRTPTIGQCPKQFLQSLPTLLSAEYLVMIPPDHVQVDDLKELVGTKISGVRFTCSEGNINTVSALGKRCKDLGLKTCANIIRISELNKTQLRQMVRQLHASGLDAIYAADSNGALYPEQVAVIVNEIRNHYDGSIGFHGHDSIHLSVANALAAIRAGATWIDGTIGGVGKGGGNAPIEVLLAQAAQSERRAIDIDGFATALPYFDQDFFPNRFTERLNNVLYGIENLNLDAIKERQNPHLS